MKKWKKISLICILFIAGLVLVNIYYLNPRLAFIITSDPVFPSVDQREVIQHFGYPDTFLLSMKDQARFETWAYYEIERSFVFLNGDFVEAKIIANLGEKYQYPKFRPTQFENNSNLNKVNRVLGDPLIQGQVAPEILENTTIYDYWDQVKVAVQNNQVILIQTLPVLVPEELRIKN